MMGRFRIFALLMSICLLSCSSSSSDDSGDNPSGDVTISCSPTRIDVPANGGIYTVTVVASKGGWTAEDSKACDGYWWLEVSTKNANKTMGTVTINVAENTDKKPRQGAVDIRLGDKAVYVEVYQASKTVTPIDGGELVVPDGYKLVWNDEFNEGSELNSTDWRHEVQKSGWVNNELQNYVKDDKVASVSNGTLKINLIDDGGTIKSARLYARRSTGWKYGYIEARIKLPKGKGTWPAFWMMPVNFNSWPGDGEIDIMEEVGYDPNMIVSTIHCNKYNNTGTAVESARRKVDTAQSDFHVYAMEWTSSYMTFYVDGSKLLTYNNDGSGKDAWPFDAAFYPILNLAWGGAWGGLKGTDPSCLPATMEVDYVRVFQK